MRGVVHYQDMLSVHLTALKEASVEEVHEQEKVMVGGVREEDGDAVLVAALTSAAQQRPQYSLEVD